MQDAVDARGWYRDLAAIVDNENAEDEEDVLRALERYISGGGVECNRMGSLFLESCHNVEKAARTNSCTHFQVVGNKFSQVFIF